MIFIYENGRYYSVPKTSLLTGDEKSLYIVKKYLEGVSFYEIGKELNLMEGTTRNLFKDVINKIKTIFGINSPGGNPNLTEFRKVSGFLLVDKSDINATSYREHKEYWLDMVNKYSESLGGDYDQADK